MPTIPDSCLPVSRGFFLLYWGCQLSHTVTHSCGKVVYTYLSVPVQRHCGKTPSWPPRQPGPPPPVGKQGWAGGRCADPGCCSESPQPPGQTGTAEVSVDGCNKDLSINDGNYMGLRLTLEPFQRKYWGNFWDGMQNNTDFSKCIDTILNWTLAW